VKVRLDVLLVSRGLAGTREKARALIMAGEVYSSDRLLDKPGMSVDEGLELSVRGRAPYVSRGGLKLEKAVVSFGIVLEGLICADIGASTGGFTDCMLQRGAAQVYAVDVGYGQLAWKLREDPRVVSLERTNARYLTAEDIAEKLDFFSVDVSFISLSKIFPALAALVKEDASGVCLIKPQFEAGRDRIGKNGVVRDAKVHAEVIEQVIGYARESGFHPAGLDFSPVRGPRGNIEYLLHLKKIPQPSFSPDIPALTELAHREAI